MLSQRTDKHVVDVVGLVETQETDDRGDHRRWQPPSLDVTGSTASAEGEFELGAPFLDAQLQIQAARVRGEALAAQGGLGHLSRLGHVEPVGSPLVDAQAVSFVRHGRARLLRVRPHRTCESPHGLQRQARQPLAETLEWFGTELDRREPALWRAKLGLERLDGPDAVAAADQVVTDLFRVLTLTETDMTLFFRGLSQIVARVDEGTEGGGAAADHPDEPDRRLAPLAEAYYAEEHRPGVTGDVRAATAAWLDRYLELARGDGRTGPERAAAMDAVNPRYVLRNYLAQLAIDAAERDDFSEIEELLDVLRRPYDDQPGRERFAARRPEWARERPGCSQLSCSS